MGKLISILIPVYNEEDNVFSITEAVQQVFKGTSYLFEILFVNDGSNDQTLCKVKDLCKLNNNIFYISFSRNFGKDNALLAGLKHLRGDAAITIDADMQHPPELIPDLIKFWEEGNDVVYTYRETKNHHASKRTQFTSKFFYKALNNLSDIELEDGIADFRIIDRKVINVINNLHEDKPFFRGLLKWVGFTQKALPYNPNARKHGETKYNTKALIRLALQGITSFSTKPLQLAIYMGLTISLMSLLYIPYVIISLYYDKAISGWSSIIVTIAFFGGLQLMILGIIGIYLGKLFMQSKQRPQFIIKESNIL